MGDSTASDSETELERDHIRAAIIPSDHRRPLRDCLFTVFKSACLNGEEQKARQFVNGYSTGMHGCWHQFSNLFYELLIRGDFDMATYVKDVFVQYHNDNHDGNRAACARSFLCDASVTYALRRGRVDILQYIATISRESFLQCYTGHVGGAILAAERGQLDSFKWLYRYHQSEGTVGKWVAWSPSNISLIFRAASRHGHTHVMQWLAAEEKLDVKAMGALHSTCLNCQTEAVAWILGHYSAAEFWAMEGDAENPALRNHLKWYENRMAPKRERFMREIAPGLPPPKLK